MTERQLQQESPKHLSAEEMSRRKEQKRKFELRSLLTGTLWANVLHNIIQLLRMFGSILLQIFGGLGRFAQSLGKVATWKRAGRNAKAIVKMFFSNRSAATGTVIMLFFVLLALFGRAVFPYNSLTDEAMKYLPPSAQHWLGTDNLGRDVFGQLVHGARDVLTIAFLTSLITIFLGTFIGMLSGLLGGWPDRIIQIVTNLFLSIPSFPVLLILAAFFTIEDPLSFAIVLSVWGWAGLGRAIRSQIISLKERDFIQVCKVMNLSKTHILFQELVPNIASYILINFVMIMRSAITGSVGIMMLGLAAFQPSNWGAMLLRAKDAGALLIPEASYFLFAPIVAILLFQMGAILLANGLDETLNPRLRKN